MNVKIYKSTASGIVSAPRSKSMAHRLMISAALANGLSRISYVTLCDDVLATLDCLCALGVCSESEGKIIKLCGTDMKNAKPTAPLNCRESGSTLRFMLPIALLSGESVEFVGSKRLLERPMDIYENLCKEQGLTYERSNGKITVKGPLRAGDIYLPANVSSQFITGLMFALSTLLEDSRIIMTTELESRSYIELTRAAMATFGVEVIWENERTLYIKGAQEYKPQWLVSVEGDYSGAAFLEALNLLGGNVEILGLTPESLQGDRVYTELFPILKYGAPTINIDDCPDLAPILFALAAANNGATFTGTRRLKIKESDRAGAMAEELAKFGASLIVEENRVTVEKCELHEPTEMLSGHNDHRIVMSLAVLSTVYGGEISGAEAVKKSYPDFFEDIKRLGIKFDCYET